MHMNNRKLNRVFVLNSNPKISYLQKFLHLSIEPIESNLFSIAKLSYTIRNQLLKWHCKAKAIIWPEDIFERKSKLRALEIV